MQVESALKQIFACKSLEPDDEGRAGPNITLRNHQAKHLPGVVLFCATNFSENYKPVSCISGATRVFI